MITCPECGREQDCIVGITIIKKNLFGWGRTKEDIRKITVI